MINKAFFELMLEFQFPLHRDPRCNAGSGGLPLLLDAFQFPLHRDPRCNFPAAPPPLAAARFQFPLHRDPRCNPSTFSRNPSQLPVSVPFTSGSSLQLEEYIEKLLEAKVSVPFTSGSSLQLYLLPHLLSPHSLFQFPLHRDPRCNKVNDMEAARSSRVSVPFTSGSSLQLHDADLVVLDDVFQFPLHRDPRCNQYQFGWWGKQLAFQFPLHRDPRCNVELFDRQRLTHRFSSLYIGILAATEGIRKAGRVGMGFSSLYIGILAATNIETGEHRELIVSVPFTSGSSLQRMTEQQVNGHSEGFSSLYIGILAATEMSSALFLAF